MSVGNPQITQEDFPEEVALTVGLGMPEEAGGEQPLLEGLDRKCFSRLRLSRLWLHYALGCLWEMRELGPCPLPSAFRSLAWGGHPLSPPVHTCFCWLTLHPSPPPFPVFQAQAVTLTVAQAFKVAFEFWQVSKEGESSSRAL